MPGLSQLKKFNSDILSLGKEGELRASRGEKPAIVPIPKTIKDTDDSEDFVLGMPENVEDTVSSDEELAGADDFSDITGEKKPFSAQADAPNTTADKDVPDVSALLNPIVPGGSAGADVPDLSQFMEAPSEPEQAPEPPSIADLSLDDLLGSAGFDAAETETEEQPEEIPAEPNGADDVIPPEDVVHGVPDFSEPETVPDSFAVPDVPEPLFSDEPEAIPEAEEPSAAEESEQFFPADTTASDEFEPVEPLDFSSEENLAENAPDEQDVPHDDFDYAGQSIDMNAGLAGDFNESDAGIADAELVEPEPAESAGAEPGSAEPETAEAESERPSRKESDVSDAAAPEEDFNLPDFNISEEIKTSGDEAYPETSETGTSPLSSAGSGLPDEQEQTSVPVPEDSVDMSSFSGTDDLNLPDMGTGDFNPDSFDFNLDDTDGGTDEKEESSAAEDAAPPEHFDTSEMDGLDFSIKETDQKLADSNKSDFELGEGSDFQNESTDFEIPGFSDTSTVQEDKRGKIKLPVPDFNGAAEGDRPGKNTLTAEQYRRFLSNLTDYPLNVRIAVENLLVKNEFTDDAQFEVIEKVISRVPARQIAAHLEKMLDISIPVPRDFERRTAAEYDAYKSSLQYQVRNRIIPAVIVSAAALLLAFGLFRFFKNFVYKPLKANNLYSQGYALLQADEYPQSEMKFNEAVKYQLQKGWFYKYARGYRTHKQYQRAEKMYRNILYAFNHDKTAGIEYAQMECDDLANYEKAEEVARREVLDYHINDPDGILLLGDIYLEWGTEKDAAKLEDARKEYATLVQLYGQTDLYMSRMMRYFIRSDNLREVLQLKERFYPQPKSLGAQDWTELSGYLLDKLYGTLPPSDEYLRTRIEDVKDMLVRAVKADPSNPVALYNMSRYFVHMNNGDAAVQTLERTISAFKKAPERKRRDTYKEIDSYRLLGEQYIRQKEYLKAQEQYTDGITLFTDEQANSGLEGTEKVGKLYADAGDIDYFIRGNTDSAYDEYTAAVRTKYDTPTLHYRIGYIEYSRGDYDKAVGSFIKTSEDKPEDNHLLLAMANALSLRDDNYAAQGYYERLIGNLDVVKEQKGLFLPQVRADQAELVDLYLKASNNLGVTLFRLARRTGNSRQNADAMVQLSTSMRAWDAMTRNQTTMVRLPGSNLAEQNMKYMSHPTPDYEPAIYTDIPRILSGEEELTQ